MINNGNATPNESSQNNNNGGRGKSNSGRRNNNSADKKPGNANPETTGKSTNPKGNNSGQRNPSNANSNKKNGENRAPNGNRAGNGNRVNGQNRNGKKNGHNGNSTALDGSLSGHENPTVFERFATRVSKAAGSTPAFIGALLIVVGWAVCGPIFNFSETWQLFINTGTTIITFLMVFLIQKAQNKDSLAIQLKLNELVASHEYSSNRLVDIENMTEDEMIIVQKYYRSLSELSKKDEKLQTSHSIEEAEEHHERKSGNRARRNKDR